MPPTEPGTQFDGHSTYITQAGYDAMLCSIEKSGQDVIDEENAHDAR